MSSSTSTAAKEQASSASTTHEVSTDAAGPPHDGRKDSSGAPLTSTATQAWRPDINRQQSFNQEDMKHHFQMSQVHQAAKASTTPVSGGFTETKDRTAFTDVDTRV